MADQRDGGIAWTDQTWNPTRGCSRVSPGCENCYAERVAARFSGLGQPYHGLAIMSEHGPRWTREVRLVHEHLEDPIRWARPRRIFVNSMSDLFHEALSNEEIAAVFGVMAATSRHTFQILTKRSKRMRRWFEWLASLGPFPRKGQPDIEGADALVPWCVDYYYNSLFLVNLGSFVVPSWPLPNVWLGVSVEDQARAEERIPDLVRTPAAVRFLSYEPALGPLDLAIEPDATTNRFGLLTCPMCRGWGGSLTSLVPTVDGAEQIKACSYCGSTGSAVDWIIIGGESGPGARPFDLAWGRRVVEQCASAGVAAFFKQAGSNPIGLRLRDRSGGDMAEWPEDLRIREFPGGSDPCPVSTRL